MIRLQEACGATAASLLVLSGVGCLGTNPAGPPPKQVVRAEPAPPRVVESDPTPAPVAPAVPPAAVAHEWVLVADLPTDSGLEEPDAEAPLPVRVTLYWNAAMRAAKVYVGSRLAGVEDEGLTRAASMMREVREASPSAPIEIDADPTVPFAHVVRTVDLARAGGATGVYFAAGGVVAAVPAPAAGLTIPDSALPPASTGAASTRASSPRTMILFDASGACALAPADRRDDSSRGIPDAGAALEAALRPLADAQRLAAQPLLSDAAVLIRADGRTPWAYPQAALIACAKCGIWKIELAVAASAPR